MLKILFKLNDVYPIPLWHSISPKRLAGSERIAKSVEWSKRFLNISREQVFGGEIMSGIRHVDHVSREGRYPGIKP